MRWFIVAYSLLPYFLSPRDDGVGRFAGVLAHLFPLVLFFIPKEAARGIDLKEQL